MLEGKLRISQTNRTVIQKCVQPFYSFRNFYSVFLRAVILLKKLKIASTFFLFNQQTLRTGMIIARQSLQGLCRPLLLRTLLLVQGPFETRLTFSKMASLLIGLVFLTTQLTYPGDLQPLQPKKERLVYLLLVNRRCLNFYNRCFILLKLIGHQSSLCVLQGLHEKG